MSQIKTNTATIQSIMDKLVRKAAGGSGLDTSDATATAEKILSPETAYVNGVKVTGTMPDNGTVNAVLDTETTEVTIAEGAHSGEGTVSIVLEEKTVTPSTAVQEIVPSEGKVLSKVTVGAAETGLDTSDATAVAGDMREGDTAYVDGEKVTGTVPTRTSSDVTASGATVSVPAGIYDSAVSKSVSTATQATPSITVNSSGLITASATQSAGYVSSGTKSATKQLTTQAAKTVTPTESTQTVVASGVYTTGAVKVGAIPSTYVKPTATKAAATITPGTSSQTIAAGTYCSGKQTIAGDSDLVASNIKSGVSIFGVTGTYSGSGNSEYVKIYYEETVSADEYVGDVFQFTFTPSFTIDPTTETLLSLMVFKDGSAYNQQIASFFYNYTSDYLTIHYIDENGEHKTAWYSSNERSEDNAYLEIVELDNITAPAHISMKVGVYVDSYDGTDFAGYDSWADNTSPYHIVAVFGSSETT